MSLGAARAPAQLEVMATGVAATLGGPGLLALLGYPVTMPPSPQPATRP